MTVLYWLSYTAINSHLPSLYTKLKWGGLFLYAFSKLPFPMFSFVNDNGSLLKAYEFVNKATTESQKRSIFDSISLEDILELIIILVNFILSKKTEKCKGFIGCVCLFIQVFLLYKLVLKVDYLPP